MDNILLRPRLWARLMGLCAALLLGTAAQAQVGNDWVEESGIEDAQLVIEKQKVLTLPKASRSFGKMARREKPADKQEQEYVLNLVSIDLPDLDPSIRMQADKSAPLPPLYRGYVKAGFGNYLAPYLAGHFGSLRSERHAYGISLRHLSAFRGPIDKQFSASGQTELMGYGKLSGKTSTLMAQAGYRRRGLHFYGYEQAPAERDSIRQAFNEAWAQLQWDRPAAKRSPLGLQAGLDLSYFSDAYTAREMGGALTVTATYALGKESRLRAVLQPIGNLRYWADTLMANRSLAKFGVAWELDGQRLQARIGARAAYDFDTTTQVSQITAYPDLSLRYSVAPGKMVAYLTAAGDLRQQTLRSVTNDNPFLHTGSALRHTHQLVDAVLGVELAPSEKVGIRLEGGYDLAKNRQLLLNLPADFSRFGTVYDGEMTGAFRATAAVSAQVGRVRAAWEGTFWQYSMEELAEAFHLPTLSNRLSLTYYHPEKLTVKLDAFQWSGMAALDEQGAAFTLDPIVDLSLRADYAVAENASVFLHAKNLLAHRYERYYRYPTMGLNAVLGGTFLF